MPVEREGLPPHATEADWAQLADAQRVIDEVARNLAELRARFGLADPPTSGEAGRSKAGPRKGRAKGKAR